MITSIKTAAGHRRVSMFNHPFALRVQLTTFLAAMWASILSGGAAIWLVTGETAFLQVSVTFGILMTGLILHRARCAAEWQELRFKEISSDLVLSFGARESWRACSAE